MNAVGHAAGWRDSQRRPRRFSWPWTKDAPRGTRGSWTEKIPSPPPSVRGEFHERGAVRRGDSVLFMLTVALIGVGLLAVYSASAIIASTQNMSNMDYLIRQAQRAAVGFVVLFFGAWLDYHHYERRWKVIFGTGIALLIGVIVAGHAAKGAQRWFLGFQPVEVARIATYVALSVLLAKASQAQMQSFLRGIVLPLGAIVGPVALLVLKQPNLGSTLALCGVAIIMLVVAGAKWRHLAMVGGAAAALALAMVLSHPYMMARVQTFLHPSADIKAHGWQVQQSLIAFGSGGVFGRGFGGSLQKLYFLPEPHTDFILAIVGEECGLWGPALILILLGALVLRGIRTARLAKDSFGFYLALALASGLAVYTLLNTAVVTRLIPTTGLPLPFISYGGSALTMNMFAVGVLLNISYQGARRGTARGGVVVGTSTGRESRAG